MRRTISSRWATAATSPTVARSSISSADSARRPRRAGACTAPGSPSAWLAVRQVRPSPPGHSGPRREEGDGPHRLADRDHRVTRLPGDALRGPVPWCQTHRSGGRGSGTSWTAARRMVPPDSSSTMAPSILASSRSRVAENSVPQLESARAHFLDSLVVPEHDERSGVAAQNPLQAVAERRARRQHGERGATALVSALLTAGTCLTPACQSALATGVSAAAVPRLAA